jgi:hypothetical protein
MSAAINNVMRFLIRFSPPFSKIRPAHLSLGVR